MGRLLILTAVLGCFAASILNADTTKKPTAEKRVETPAGNEVQVICRKEHVLGSHFKRRVCRTRQMIEQDKRDVTQYSQELDRMRDAERMSQSREW